MPNVWPAHCLARGCAPTFGQPIAWWLVSLVGGVAGGGAGGGGCGGGGGAGAAGGGGGENLLRRLSCMVEQSACRLRGATVLLQ